MTSGMLIKSDRTSTLVENKEPAFRKLASSPVRGHGCLCDDGGGVDSAWAGVERRRWAVASTGEEDVRQGTQG
jgi:hypothetical protein